MTTQTPDQQTLNERRQAFGRRLVAAREAQGIPRNALAQTTRISINFVEALETGAFERLPGDVFARGFIRNLCKALRIDAGALLEEFAACSETPAPKPVLEIEVKSTPQVSRFADWRGLAKEATKSLPARQIRQVARVGVGIALMCAAIYAVGVTRAWERIPQWLKDVPATATLPTAILPADKTTTKATPAPSEPVETPAPAATEEAVTPTSDAGAAHTEPVAAPGVVAPVASGQTLELVVTEPVRIRIELDSGESTTKEYKPDTYQLSFSSQADLLIFDANAVKIRYNGRPLGALGVKGRVRRLSFDANAPKPENSL